MLIHGEHLDILILTHLNEADMISINFNPKSVTDGLTDLRRPVSYRVPFATKNFLIDVSTFPHNVYS